MPRHVPQFLKRAAFRWPILRDVFRPRYQFNIHPSQLVWLANALDATRGSGGCVVEVGVARGMTSMFLLQHMNMSDPSRTYYCIDTFGGFTARDVAVETAARGKRRGGEFNGFSYADAATFERNLRLCGFRNFKVISGDAARVDWSQLPPIDVMLLDVDLYAPTKAVLESSRARWSRGARIMVDDCQAVSANRFDGAGQAYREFCQSAGIEPCYVGAGGVITSGAPGRSAP